MTCKPISLNRQTQLKDARPIALLVQVASQFKSSIYIESETQRINAKSIMGMMSLGLLIDQQLTVTADGPDEQEAIEKIEEYLTKEM